MYPSLSFLFVSSLYLLTSYILLLIGIFIIPILQPSPYTYTPGDLSGGISCDNGKYTLSKGLKCEVIATGDQKVQYADGTSSSAEMHRAADGAGVIAQQNADGSTDGGWYYCSNSERNGGNGGGEKLCSP